MKNIKNKNILGIGLVILLMFLFFINFDKGMSEKDVPYQDDNKAEKTEEKIEENIKETETSIFLKEKFPNEKIIFNFNSQEVLEFLEISNLTEKEIEEIAIIKKEGLKIYLIKPNEDYFATVINGITDFYTELSMKKYEGLSKKEAIKKHSEETVFDGIYGYLVFIENNEPKEKFEILKTK
jgi:hypothetical protein